MPEVQDEVVLTDVTKRFDGGAAAVDGVSVAVRRGEFFSLLGPSGCGKTTTLRMIAGFEQPTAGTIRIAGDVVNDIPAHRRQTNLVFQQLALFPHLDVFDNVGFGLRLKRRPKREIRRQVLEILEVVGLQGLERRRVSQISGGQQQRVAIARALVNEPAVLLLDEPLGALDLKLRMQMQIELKSLQHRVGTTFIYVTHDQGEALTMSDRMAVMHEGRVQQVGSGQDLYLRPESTFVASFIGDTNLLEVRVVATEGEHAVVEAEGARFRAQRTPGVRDGDRVTLSLRPEMIRLADAGEGWTMRVADVVFLGRTIRYDLTLPSGTRMTVDRPAGEPIRSPGDAVVASWDPESPVAIAASGVAAAPAAEPDLTGRSA